jgi:predicted DNA-binding protein (UPF0278 family)
MLEVYKEEIQRLKQNIDTLKQTSEKHRVEALELQEKNDELEIIVKEKELIIEDLENKYRNLLNARVLSEIDDNKDNTRKTINNLVREIDKCLALLND